MVERIGRNFQLPEKYRNMPIEDLGKGIILGMGWLSIVGNAWGVNQGKKYHPFNERTIEVIILRSAETQSKTYFGEEAWDGKGRNPVCWSSDSITPDAAVTEKQAPRCNGCPRNAWFTAPNGRRQKACGDGKKIAVTSAKDMRNEMYGGPMMFKVPFGSLSKLNDYSELLKNEGIPYYLYTTVMKIMVGEDKVTRIEFDYGRPLTEEECELAIELRDAPNIMQQLTQGAAAPEVNDATNGEPPPAAAPAQAKAPPQPAPAATPRVTPRAEPAKSTTINEAVARPAAPPPTQRTVKPVPTPTDVILPNEIEEAGQVPDELDDMFGGIMGPRK